MRLTIRKKIILSITVMLVPVVLVSLVSYFMFQHVLKQFELVIHEAIHEMAPVHELQQLVLKSAMPTNDFLIHGSQAERSEYSRLALQVDMSIAKLQNNPHLNDEEREILEQVKQQWLDNKQHAAEILSSNSPLDNPVLVLKMEAYDLEVNAVSELLNRFDTIVHRELDEYLANAFNKRNTLMFSHAILLILSILIALITSAYLVRKIIMPIQTLQQGAHDLGSGNLRSRIRLATRQNDEIGQLATTFNHMADELEKLATRDDLTGLFNKREFERLLNEEIRRSIRTNQPLSLLMIDLDHFKSINDQYGHLSGDMVLQVFASFLISQLRGSDHGARFGGEEFAIILPNTELEDAAMVAERIRLAIETLPVHINDETRLDISISVGVTSCSLCGRRIDMLLSSADQALYVAKHSGRNCVAVFDAQSISRSA